MKNLSSPKVVLIYRAVNTIGVRVSFHGGGVGWGVVSLRVSMTTQRPTARRYDD